MSSVRAGEHGARTHVPLVWIGALLTAVLLIALISRAMIQTVPSDSPRADVSRVARLSADPESTISDYFTVNATTPGPIRGFTEFFGLQVMVSSNSYTSSGLHDRCLQVTKSTDFVSGTATSNTGRIFEGCSEGTAPAAVTLTVSKDMPEELSRAFPAGTALQFVYMESTSDVVMVSATGRG